MKKLLFGLIATVFFSGAAMAQKVSSDQLRKQNGSQMLAVVNIAKSFYQPGQTYEGFLQAMLIPSPTFPSQDAFFRKVYGYVSSNTSECSILTSDNTILQTFVTDASKNKAYTTPSAKVNNPPKKWWMIAINFVVNTAATIIGSNNNVDMSNIPKIDFWPEYY